MYNIFKKDQNKKLINDFIKNLNGIDITTIEIYEFLYKNNLYSYKHYFYEKLLNNYIDKKTIKIIDKNSPYYGWLNTTYTKSKK